MEKESEGNIALNNFLDSFKSIESKNTSSETEL
jgi:hypothetical protein